MRESEKESGDKIETVCVSGRESKDKRVGLCERGISKMRVRERHKKIESV